MSDNEILDIFRACYDLGALPVGRAIEQAARMEALESALGICAAVMTDSMNKDGEAACEACMVAIRALMGEEG